MDNPDRQSIIDAVYEALETSLESQLRAIRRLRNSEKETISPNKGMSHVDMAYNILNKAGSPLHINEIIRNIEITYRIQVDRESLVSAITKKVTRGDRFSRVGKNTFQVLNHPSSTEK